MFSCILTRLPVKSIVQCKSVCKPWLRLLSAPDFVKLRHAHSSSDPKNGYFFIDNRDSSLFNIESGKNIDLPYPEPASNMDCVGSCNGLICLGSFRGGTTTTRGSVCLWNPAMKLFKLVRLSSPHEYFMSLGFGYDAEVDDYKVVRICYLKKLEAMEAREIDRVEVYSVKSDSWTKIDPGFKFDVLDERNDVVVNGNPYWVARDQKWAKHFLVCFDVKRMVLETVPVTSTIIDEHTLLVDWNGCVGAIVCALDDGEVVNSIDVWVFEDGWRKNRSFEPPAELKNSWSLGWDLVGLKNGKILAVCHYGQMWLFDYDTGSFEEVSAPPSFEIFPYSKSLVSFQGMEEEVRMTQ